MTEQVEYYSVRVGIRGNTPNRGEHPTGEDYYQASALGIAPTDQNVAVAVEIFQPGHLAPTVTFIREEQAVTKPD